LRAAEAIGRGDADVVSDGHSFLEGPRWHDGSLYASDFYTREILRWDGGRGAPETVCRVAGMPSGLGWTPEGDLLVVSMADRRLLRLGAEPGLVEVADLSDHAPWHCNDMVVDEDGRAYVGNLGWDDENEDEVRDTVLLRVDPDGLVEVVADGLVNPNGMAITPDGRTLLVAETFAARITAFERDADGTLGRRRVWGAFADEFATVSAAFRSGAVLPDGIALDADGALWVGDCRGSAALRVAEGGEVIERVSTGESATFAVALGGVDRRTLFLCTGPPYGTSDPARARDGAMCSHPVAVPGLP
jgi:sugar lactone lactonase YvrE